MADDNESDDLLAELQYHCDNIVASEVLGEIEQKRRLEHKIFIHPAVEDRVREVVDRINPEFLNNIIVSSSVPQGTFYIVDQAAIDASFREAMKNWRPYE